MLHYVSHDLGCVQAWSRLPVLMGSNIGFQTRWSVQPWTKCTKHSIGHVGWADKCIEIETNSQSGVHQRWTRDEVKYPGRRAGWGIPQKQTIWNVDRFVSALLFYARDLLAKNAAMHQSKIVDLNLLTSVFVMFNFMSILFQFCPSLSTTTSSTHCKSFTLKWIQSHGKTEFT